MLNFFMLNRWRLRSRIGLLVAGSLMAMFAILAFLATQALRTATDTLLNQRLVMAGLAAHQIDNALVQRLSLLENLARTPIEDLQFEDLHTMLNSIQSVYNPDRFHSVFILDADGNLVWEQPYIPELIGKPILDYPAAQQALHSAQPQISCLKDLQSGQTLILMITPLFTSQDQVIGLLGGTLDPQSAPLSSLLQFAPPELHTYIHLVNQDGINLVHSNPAMLFQRDVHASLIIQLLKQGQSQIVMDNTTHEGREVIAFVPLQNVPWGIVLEQREQELLVNFSRLQKNIWLFFGITLIAALGLVAMTTRSVTAPINRLLKAAQTMTTGDLSHKLLPEGQDEIAQLTEAIEILRRRLRQREEVLSTWGEQIETAVAQRTRELQTLYTIDHAAAQSLDLDEILGIALDTVSSTLSTDEGSIYLLDKSETSLERKVGRGMSTKSKRLSIQDQNSPIAQAARESKIVLHPDEKHSQTTIAAPLLSGGALVGVIELCCQCLQTLSTEDYELLTAIGSQLGSAIHKVRLFWITQQRLSELRLLFAVAEAIRQANTLDELLPILLKQMVQSVEAKSGAIWLTTNGNLVCRAGIGNAQPFIGQRHPRQQGVLGELLQPDQARNYFQIKEDNQTRIYLPLRSGQETLGAVQIGQEDRQAFTDSEQRLLIALVNMGANAILRLKTTQHLRTLSIETVRALAAAIDARDPYTHGHSEDVARLSVLIGKALNWPAQSLEKLEFAALLHDVGKIGIPDKILKKAGKLTADETTIMRQHPFFSAQIIRPITPLNKEIPCVLHHHERWDGEGYPDGLAGEEISIGARIIAVADTFNAMTTDRPYRKALSVQAALDEIRAQAGKQFDPQIVEVFLNAAQQSSE